MASEHSFDIVSKLDFQEFDNAINQATKEIRQRYDLKDANASIELNKKDLTLTIISSNETSLKSVIDVLHSKLIKRSISIKSIKYEKLENAQHNSVRQFATLKQGIDKETSKKINVAIKNLKLKVTSSTQGETIRVTSKSLDSLQTVQKKIKELNLSLPVQYVNYR